MEEDRLGSRMLALAAVGIMLVTAGRAEGTLVRIDFAAEVTLVRAGSSVVPGESVSGSIIYEAATEWTDRGFSPLQTNYLGAIAEFEIAGREIDIQSSNIVHAVSVSFDPSRQSLGFGQTGFRDGFVEQLNVDFEGPNLFDSVFDLPVSFDFDEVTDARFTYNLLDPSDSPFIRVDSFLGTIQSVQFTVVPEPSTAMLLIFGFGALGLGRRQIGRPAARPKSLSG